MDVEFKFKIGDDVMYAATKRSADGINVGAKPYARATPQRFTVIERAMAECYGGIQLNYWLRACDAADRLNVTVGIRSQIGPNGLYPAVEIELLPFDDTSEDEAKK